MKTLALMIGLSTLAVSMPVAAEGDPANGERLFRRCATCHVLTEGGRKVGPSLYGLFGRTSGTVEGFKYSQAMKDAAITWNEETLDEYITNPRAYIPGNRMAFPGIRNAEQRSDMIAYLKEATAKK